MVRVVTDEPSLAAIDAHLSGRLAEFGITRIADVSGLDRVGINTHCCVCPDSGYPLTVFSGKGITRARSRVSAIMECIERTTSVWDETRVRWCTSQEIEDSEEKVWLPRVFTEGKRPDVREDDALPWIQAELVRDGSRVWVPADLAFSTGPSATSRGRGAFRVTSSSGLAGDLSEEGATARALAEIIERDAVSCIELKSSHLAVSFLGAVADAAGLDAGWLADAFRDDSRETPALAPSSLPPSIAALYESLSRTGAEVVVRAVPNDFGVPVYAASAIEQFGLDTVIGMAGYGVAIDADEAVEDALLELAQSRTTDLQGAREDVSIGAKARLNRVPAHHWLAASAADDHVDYREHRWAAAPVSADGAAVLRFYCDQVEQVGLCDIARVVFRRYDGVVTVRVLVPEAETWHATEGSSRLGRRMQAWQRMAPTARQRHES